MTIRRNNLSAAKKKLNLSSPSLPSKVTVLGKEFDIEYSSDMDKIEYGETQIEERIIKININRSKKTWKATLLHEVVHAGLGLTGRAESMTGDDEESIVIFMENLLEDFVEFDSE